MPSLLRVSTGQPMLMRVVTNWACPLLAAYARGVMPVVLRTFTLPPASSRSLMIAMLPHAAACDSNRSNDNRNSSIVMIIITVV